MKYKNLFWLAWDMFPVSETNQDSRISTCFRQSWTWLSSFWPFLDTTEKIPSVSGDG